MPHGWVALALAGSTSEPVMTVAIRQASETFTPRQQAVLTAALDLLVEAGDGLTMTAVARRAMCDSGAARRMCWSPRWTVPPFPWG